MNKVIPLRKDVLREPRQDGWANLVTMLGTNADKRTHSKIRWELRDPEFYEQLYSGGGIAARIVDIVPDEAMREGWDWTNVEPDQKEMLNEKAESLDLRGAMLKTWKWGRAYGGACMHIVTDTKDPSSPLRMGERVLGLRDLSRWDLRVLTTDIEYDFGSPNFGHPRIYYLNVQMGSQYKGYPIHWTRMVRFDGQLVPRRTFVRNNYWHDSILNRLYDTIRDYQISNDAAAACLQDFNVDVFSMKNLSQLIGAGKEQIVKNRIEMMMFAKSVLNAMVIDADTESYENKSRKLEGVAELLKYGGERLVAETDIPHTKLLGESPDGSNATGNSTSQQWNNFLSSEQKNYLSPKLKRIQMVLFGDLPRLGHKFHSLRKLDALEEATLRKTQSETDSTYISDGVLDPSEVSTSRFGGEEYSTDTTLDKEARAAGMVPSTPGQGNLPGEIEQDPTTQETPGVGDEPGDESEGNQGPPKPPGSKKPVPPKPGAKPGEKPAKEAPDASKPDPKAEAEETEKKDADEPVREARTIEPGASAIAAQEMPLTGGEFDLRNDKTPPAANPKPEVKQMITQMMSEPMRDPRTDPLLPGPGIPIKQRTFLPTRGTGVTAPSGFDMTLDAGKSGEAQDSGARQDASEAIRRAATIIVRRGDHFLMGKRRDNGRWSLPGGKIEAKESHHAGAVRELAEETGLTASRLKFVGGRMVEPKQGETVHVNIYEHKAGDAGDRVRVHGRKDPDQEFDEYKWFSVKEKLPEEVMGNLQHPNNVALQHLGLLK